MKHLLPILLVIYSSVAYSADDFKWLFSDGSVAPNTDSQKSINGFGGWLVVTPDKDWKEKWETPSDHTPSFTEAKEVKIGEVLTILPFYVNPKLDDDLGFELYCDIKVQRPNGTYSINEKGILCAGGVLQGNPYNIRLTSTLIKYSGDHGDPMGEWTVEFVITDNLRNVSLPLKTSFFLVGNKG